MSPYWLFVTDAVELEVFFCFDVPVFAGVFEAIQIDDVTQQARLVSAGNIFFFDLLADVTFFVGQEVVDITATAD